MNVEERIAPEELNYGIDVAGLDFASLTDSLRAVIADAMADPLRMSTWLTGLALAEQNVGLNMLRRLGGETPAPVFSGDKRFSEPEWSANPMLAAVEDYQARTNAALSLLTRRVCRQRRATRRASRCSLCAMPFRRVIFPGLIPASSKRQPIPAG